MRSLSKNHERPGITDLGPSLCPGGPVHTITILLLALAAICFLLAAIGIPSRVNLVALGLLAWVLTVLIPALTTR